MTLPIGLRIKLIRTLMGKTQADFAKEAGIHRPVLSIVESGRLKPSDDFTGRIESSLGVSLNDPRFDEFAQIVNIEVPLAA